MWAMVSYLMTIVFKVADDFGFKFKTCVIATNMNLHDR
jgi:hypothetical protein